MTHVEFVPNLRMMFVGDDGHDYGDLHLFADWLDTQGLDATTRIFMAGKLNKRQCRDFWEYIGRTDRVPKELSIFCNKEDVERMWGPITKAPK